LDFNKLSVSHCNGRRTVRSVIYGSLLETRFDLNQDLRCYAIRSVGGRLGRVWTRWQVELGSVHARLR